MRDLGMQGRNATMRVARWESDGVGRFTVTLLDPRSEKMTKLLGMGIDEAA